MKAKADKAPPRRTASATKPEPRLAEASEAPETPAARPAEPEGVRVFGVPVPGGRRIKETFETLSETVTSLPSRL